MHAKSPVIAIYGGSFNPPHVGHAMVAQYLLWTHQVDAVWLLPVYRHAFEGRHDKVLAPFEDRVRWCEAMAADLLGDVRVCTVEKELVPPSYTFVTLRHLAQTHPQVQFRLVIGADSLPQLPDWHRWDDIAAQFDPILIGRQGHPKPPHVPTIDMPGVSSTEVRRRILRHEPIDHLVTRGVARALGDWAPGRHDA